MKFQLHRLLAVSRFLWCAGRRHHVVSPVPSRNSARFRCRHADLALHCVSHHVFEQSADFFKDHRNFEPHCVSHDLPRDSGQRSPLMALTAHPQALTQPVRTLCRGLALAPMLTRPPVPLTLAVRSTAHVLPVPGARMWTKPTPADAARSLAAHRVLRTKSENRTAPPPSGQWWVSSDKRRRVNSGERRREGGLESPQRSLALLSASQRNLQQARELIGESVFRQAPTDRIERRKRFCNQ
jgi:hypothetical protein